MVQLDFFDQMDLKIELEVETSKAQSAIQEMLDKLNRGVGAMVTGAAGALGLGGGANAEGDVKGADERSKVRTDALKKLAQQFPGGGLMTSMASAFKGGGMIAGVATGITAVVGILTNIMKSSKVFQTLSGTVFKVLGFMADMFLMPFVPLMMKFITWMLTHMPQIMRAGEKTAAILEGVLGWMRRGSENQEAGKERGGVGGTAQSIMGGLMRPRTLIGAGLVAGGVGMSIASAGALSPLGAGMMMAGGSMAYSGMKDSFQLGGKVPGGPGAEVPAMLHGGEMVIPQDIAADAKGMSGRVAAWITRFQQKEMGPGGVMDKWYDQMFGKSILPDIWQNIRGLMGSIESEARTAGQNVESDTTSMEEDNKSFWDKFKFWEYFKGPWEKVQNFFSGIGETIKEFFSFDLPKMPTWGDIGSTMWSVATKVGGFFKGIYDTVTGKEQDLPDEDDLDIPETPLKDMLMGWAKELGRWFWDPTKTGGLVWGAVKLYDLSGLDTVVSWAVTSGKFIKDCYDRATGALRNFFGKTIPGWAKSAAANIVQAVSGVFSFFGNIGSTIKDCVSLAWGAVKNFFTTTLPGFALARYEDIKNAVGGVIGNAIDIGKLVGGYLSDARAKITDTIKGWGKTIIGWVPFIGESKAFGNLQSGTLYAGAVKKIRPIIPVVVPPGCGGKGEPPCPCGGAGEPPCEEKVKKGGTGGDGDGDGGGDGDGDGQGQPGGDGIDTSPGWDPSPGGDDEWFGGGTEGGPADEWPDDTGLTSGAWAGTDSYFEYEQYGNIRGGSRRASRRASRIMRINSGPRYNNRSTRILNINIQSSLSVADIVNDIERLESMNEASFFNGVM